MGRSPLAQTGNWMGEPGRAPKSRGSFRRGAGDSGGVRRSPDSGAGYGEGISLEKTGMGARNRTEQASEGKKEVIVMSNKR